MNGYHILKKNTQHNQRLIQLSMVNLDLLFPANHLRGETTILSSKVFNHAPTNYMYYWLLYCFYTLTLKTYQSHCTRIQNY